MFHPFRLVTRFQKNGLVTQPSLTVNGITALNVFSVFQSSPVIFLLNLWPLFGQGDLFSPSGWLLSF